jgi:predicted ester cyclase
VSGSHRELYKQAIIEDQRDFPEFRVVIEDLIAEGDMVAARWRATCRFAGEGPTDPRAGRWITDTGITIVRIVGGEITDVWKHDDALGVLRQLGKLPE